MNQQAADPSTERRAARGNGRQPSDRQREQSRLAAIRSRMQDVDDRQLTQMLGWLSVGLGMTEILAPRMLGRAIGVGDHPVLMRLLGLRELASGIGLLSQQKAGSWAWSRVAGDAMDLTLLGAAVRSNDAQPERIAAAATAVMGVAALDVYASQKLMRSSLQSESPRTAASHTVTINAKPEVLYEFWRKLDNLPLFMRHLKSVSITGPKTSHWVVNPLGETTIEWDAEITQDDEHQRLSWRTLPQSEVFHEGTVTFEPAPAGRGTIVRVTLTYEPPAGEIGKHVAALMGSTPQQLIEEDLPRFKQLMETGEIATTAGQPHGERSLLGRTTLGRKLS